MQDKFFINRLENAKDLPLPCYMTPGSAGFDLYANVFEDVTLCPGDIKLIPTGIKISIPYSYEAQIRPRSGLALKYGISQVNSPGTIDADYRGEIQIILINHGKEDFIVRRGDRIAQMVINKIERVNFIETMIDEDTERGGNGFGHTGTK